jgi:hypothetical protein
VLGHQDARSLGDDGYRQCGLDLGRGAPPSMLRAASAVTAATTMSTNMIMTFFLSMASSAPQTRIRPTRSRTSSLHARD